MSNHRRAAKKYKCPAKADGCQGEFVKFNSFQKTCNNPLCALEQAIKDREKREAKERAKNRRELKKWKEDNRTIKGWCLEARRDGFNPFIRERDKDDGCIVCDSKDKAMYHAGHFMSVGSRPELQFHPDNAHKQCSGCNCSIASVSSKYRANLVKKIGLVRVEYLENYHAEFKLSIEEIKEIKAHFRDELKRLKAN